jgi:hypothetical protein
MSLQLQFLKAIHDEDLEIGYGIDHFPNSSPSNTPTSTANLLGNTSFQISNYSLTSSPESNIATLFT